MEIEHPYLIFLGDARDQLAAKTGLGIMDWRPEWCVGQFRFENCKADLGLADMSIAHAKAAGAKTLVIGVVSPGGLLPDAWIATLIQALEAGMDVAAGLHRKLSSIDEVRETAERLGRKIFDVRQSDEKLSVGNGEKRSGKRLLAMGTDCAIGKKYTALALERDMVKHGFNAEFRATGQTGILISGRGISIDAVIADFISGAAEWISPANTPDHWDVIEGQGSLFHPSFSGVTMGLLHGSQPDAFVVCHEPTRTHMRNVKTPMPTIEAVIEKTLVLGQITNPDIRCVGISINTSALEEEAALEEIEKTAARLGLPACDPIRFNGDPIVGEIERIYGKS